MDHRREKLKTFINKTIIYAEPGHPVMLPSGQPAELSFNLGLIYHDIQALTWAAEEMALLIPAPETEAICIGHILGGEHTPILYGALLRSLYGVPVNGFAVTPPPPSSPRLGLSVAATPAPKSKVINMRSPQGSMPVITAANKPNGNFQGHVPGATSKVVLVDTVITTAEKLLRCTDLLIKNQRVRSGNITVLTLINRQQSAMEAFTSRGIAYKAVFQLDEFLQ